ncbi:MAG: hypothetical protein R3218_01885, partial [Christiangramia sp.]|nr:hypothetical protein [Christiangramia sp.]
MKLKNLGLILLILCCLGCFSDNIDIIEDRRLEVTGNISNASNLENSEVLSYAGFELIGIPNYQNYALLGKG